MFNARSIYSILETNPNIYLYNGFICVCEQSNRIATENFCFSIETREWLPLLTVLLAQQSTILYGSLAERINAMSS